MSTFSPPQAGEGNSAAPSAPTLPIQERVSKSANPSFTMPSPVPERGGEAAVAFGGKGISMQTCFDIVPDGLFWVVRCQSAEYGRYRTQIQAFNAAVAEARKIKQAGRLAHVRVVREGDAPKGDFLSLL